MGGTFLQRDSLSKKETEILGLLSWGWTNKEIAGALRVSPETVKMTLRHVFQKLGVKNRTQAAILAVREKLT